MHTRPLRIAANTELLSLALLLGNVATMHLQAVSSLMGPAHGCAYLCVIGATWRQRRADGATKAVALLPGIGGLLAVRRLGRPPAAALAGH
ncbi:DUF3817 domain-containing protein [Streptomyces sp. NPDC050264]|uniref:DUF3817 domain-containing protein n=1 Tax=Streptomyces sp. NPDC050264 TaxID=3155038 RepID=UPI003442D28F